MTRKEFYDYLIYDMKCQQFPPNEFGMANAIGFKNEKTQKEAYLDTPIDNRRMRDFTIGQICFQLGVEPPPGLEHIKKVVDQVANTDFSRFPPKPKGVKHNPPSLN
ncbi:MAG: hypothetical protein V9F01_01355 [Chitinophagaceae bacterium]